MQLIIDENLCVNCGMCFHTCPAVFEQKNRCASVKSECLADNMLELALECAADCPVGAILPKD